MTPVPSETLLPYYGPQESYLERVIQSLLDSVLQQNINTSAAVRELRNALLECGYEPPAGCIAINDFLQPYRLRLIFDVNRALSLGRNRWSNGFSEGAYDSFPAGELKCDYGCCEEFWRERWQEMGGRLYGGRMIALLADAIWQRVSVYKLPWEPFDCLGGSSQASVAREEVWDLGVTAGDLMDVQPQLPLSPFYFRLLPQWQVEWHLLNAEHNVAP